uniref:Coatomer subunit zeta n=1 Tax=Ursus maritimus TaxID=29073 RepID=A0A452ULL3_URSMA
MELQEPSLYTIKAVFILDNDGHRLLAKYYDDTFPSLKEQMAFEKNVFNKTSRTDSKCPPLPCPELSDAHHSRSRGWEQGAKIKHHVHGSRDGALSTTPYALEDGAGARPPSLLLLSTACRGKALCKLPDPQSEWGKTSFGGT